MIQACFKKLFAHNFFLTCVCYMWCGVGASDQYAVFHLHNNAHYCMDVNVYQKILIDRKFFFCEKWNHANFVMLKCAEDIG